MPRGISGRKRFLPSSLFPSSLFNHQSFGGVVGTTESSWCPCESNSFSRRCTRFQASLESLAMNLKLWRIADYSDKLKVIESTYRRDPSARYPPTKKYDALAPFGRSWTFGIRILKGCHIAWPVRPAPLRNPSTLIAAENSRRPLHLLRNIEKGSGIGRPQICLQLAYLSHSQWRENDMKPCFGHYFRQVADQSCSIGKNSLAQVLVTLHDPKDTVKIVHGFHLRINGPLVGLRQVSAMLEEVLMAGSEARNVFGQSCKQRTAFHAVNVVALIATNFACCL